MMMGFENLAPYLSFNPQQAKIVSGPPSSFLDFNASSGFEATGCVVLREKEEGDEDYGFFY